MVVFSFLIAAPAVSYGATEPPVGDNIVRVHLNFYGEPTSVSMNASGSYKIQSSGQALSGPFTVSANGGGIRVTAGSQIYDLGGDIYIKAGSLAVSNLIQINGGYKYAGDMRILNKGGKLKIVNYIDIETYLVGVLPYEMNNAWPVEALKAQAIAARSYAYFVMNSKVRLTVEHDLVNSTAHQVYYGYNPAHTNCIAAVNATKNMIMKTPGGQIVFACFSASNGGMTETGAASGAAASNYDYLPLKEDPYDLTYAINSTLYSGKLYIPKTLPVNDLKNNAAQPYKMLRDKLNAAGIDVSVITGDVAVKSIVLTNPRAGGPERQFTGANFVLGVPGVGDVTVSFGPVSIAGSSARFPFLNEILNLGDKFSMLALSDAGANWLLASVRYGHGAGLSQVGAYQMAAGGKNCQEILSFYYNLGSAASLVTMPWDTGGGTDPGAPGYTVTPATLTGTVNTPGSTLNVRSGPATGYSVLTTLSHGAKVTINGQVADWWRIDTGGGKNGFVSGAFITLDPGSQPPPPVQPPAPEPAPPNPPAEQTKTGKVNTPGSTLNVRSGPGTTYSVLGSLNHGSAVTVSVENTAWYKFAFNGRTAYVSSAFITLDSQAPVNPPPAPQTKTAYVNTPGSTLNVRSGPGTGHAVMGSLKHGEKISVTDEGGEWFKLSFNGKTGYVNKTWTRADDPAAPPPPASGSKTVYVNSSIGLNVRSGPGTNHPVIGALSHGTKITVTDENSSWYKLSFNGKTGYVSKSYTTADGAAGPIQPSPPSQSSPNIGSPKAGVVTSGGVNIRSGPGTTYKIIGSLANGAKVTILQENAGWYKIDNGRTEAWVNAAYIKLNN